MNYNDNNFISISDIHKLVEKEYANKGGVVYSSSGSTGSGTSILYTEEVINGAIRRLMEIMHLTPLHSSHKVAILWGFGMFPPAHYYMEAFCRFGNKVFPLGSGKNLSSDKVIYRLHEVLPDVIVCMPSYLLKLCKLLREEYLLEDVKKYLQFIVTGGEVLTDALRNQLKEYLGVKIYDSYGMLQIPMIAGECDEERMHISQEYEAEVFCEDGNIKKSGKGILLLSSKTIWPPLELKRIYTNDITILSSEPCKCGCLTPTISILGRSNIKRKVRGQLIDWNIVITTLNSKGFSENYYIAIINDKVTFHVSKEIDVLEFRKEVNKILAIQFSIKDEKIFEMPLTNTGKIKYFND